LAEHKYIVVTFEWYRDTEQRVIRWLKLLDADNVDYRIVWLKQKLTGDWELMLSFASEGNYNKFLKVFVEYPMAYFTGIRDAD
jgi:hypothetical protein